MIHPTQWRSESGMAAVGRVRMVQDGSSLTTCDESVRKVEKLSGGSKNHRFTVGSAYPHKCFGFFGFSRILFWIFLDFASNKVNSADRWLHLPVGF